MSEQTIRVGIASFAHLHAMSYAHAVNQLEGATLTGIWDEDPERGQKYAAQFNTTFYSDLDSLLDAIDTVIVASANVDHKPLVLAAAAKKVPVLCEKPLATTPADAREMIEACAKAGVQLGTAFPVRYSDAVRKLRDAVQSGALGQTLMIRGTNRGTYPGGWFGQREKSGGGAVMDHTVHVADIVGWIWECDFAEVYAEAATRFHDTEVDDCGMLLATLANGVTLSLDPSWSRPNQSFPTWGDVTLEVTGTDGVASIDVFNQNNELFNNQTVRAQWQNWGDNLDYLMIKDWVEAIRDGKPAPISGEDGLRAELLVEAAYRSVESHQPEKVG